MPPMSAPQSTWCAESYPCFRARCESGLRVVDAKIRRYNGRLTQRMDMFTCQHCSAVPELVVDGRAQLSIVRHRLGCPTLQAQVRGRWLDESSANCLGASFRAGSQV